MISVISLDQLSAAGCHPSYSVPSYGIRLGYRRVAVAFERAQVNRIDRAARRASHRPAMI
jgi:hypothetical protein